jgi:hypothetical protein
MSNWKVMFIATFGFVCLGLATVAVPLAVDERKWLWFAGLLFATLCMGALFAVFLNRADHTFGDSRNWRDGV